MSKKIIWSTIIVILIGAGVYFTLNWRLLLFPITNFKECARAGYPVGESYPRQCWTPDGKQFVEEAMSKSAAIETIQNQFPELKEYPSDNLPPKSIKTEKAPDGWYVAFVQEGSGVPIIDARCFLVKNDNSITQRKYTPQGNNLSGEFSVRECKVIENAVGGDSDEHGCKGSAGYSWCEAKQKCLRTWEESCGGSSGSPGSSTSCAVENCHGMDIQCGPNPPGACTMMYAIGDKCLKYAQCGTVSGKCQQVENPQFTQCKSCVQKCVDANKDDNIKMFECESKCN